MGSAAGDVTGAWPVVEVEGEPYQLGYAHGRRCADLIARFARIGMPRYLGTPTVEILDELRDPLAAYAASIQEAAPHLFEEIRGIADGAGLAFEEALLLQLRPELGYVRRKRSQGCTSIGVRAERSATSAALVAQNVDMPIELGEYGIVLHLRPRSGPPILCWTLAGVVGQTGINAWGLGRCGNVVMSPGWRVGVPTAVLFRLALEQRTVGDVADLCARLPRAKSNNFLLCDRDDRVECLELTVEDQRALEAGPDGVVVHANHYRHPDLVPHDVGPYGEGSRLREKRIGELAGGKVGRIGEDDLRAWLSDHANAPHSICGHGAPGLQTLASCVLNPAEGRLWISRGNPCVAGHRCYTLASTGAAR
jgi:hypothetical protein